MQKEVAVQGRSLADPCSAVETIVVCSSYRSCSSDYRSCSSDYCNVQVITIKVTMLITLAGVTGRCTGYQNGKGCWLMGRPVLSQKSELHIAPPSAAKHD